MKKLLTALSLGLGLTVMVLGGLAAGPTLIAQARDNPPEAQMGPASNLPSLQGGTGVVRVALTGADVSGCGSVASPCRTVQFAVDEAIPGDTVVLSAGTWNESVTLSKAISLTGVSSATAIIQALPGQRVLTVTGAAIDNSVVISGLTFSGGDVSGGNVCFNGGTTNCGGGVLLTDQAQPAIQNIIIENNNAYLGGGLYANETGGLVLDHVIIRNNSAILTGGGLNAPNTPITITNSLFQQNTTTDNVGGALAASANFNVVAPVLISNTTFLSNTAQCGGGICHAPAVYLFDQDTQIINSHFEGNSCTDPNCDGGGVYMTASFNGPFLSLINNDFINNTAGGKGGGVSVGNLPQLMVVNGRFENNRALSAEGGGLDHSNFLLAAIATINGTQFISNSAALDGGGLYSVSDIAITNAIFEGNSSGENGGGLFIDFAGAGSSLTNTEFISNTAEMNGGGAYNSIGDFQVTGGRFEANWANGPESNGAFLTTENGGGGLWGGGNVTLSGTEFSGNVAETNGGGAHIRGNAVLNGGRFEQNQSLGNFLLSPGYGGGGLYSLNTLVFTDTIFSGNQAVFLGGGIWTNQNVSGLNGLLQNNTAGRGGGLFTQSSLTLTNSQLIGNQADLGGGGALVNGVTTLANVLFQANRVISTAPGTNGGGLATAGGLTGTNARFIGNRSSGNAGGASSLGPVNLLDSFFQDNISDGSGGGLGAAFAPVTTYGTTFINNTAEFNGGGIAASGAIHSNEELFQNNRANTNSGGALYTGGRVFITNTQIISNTAGQNGGGVWANSGLTGINGRLENNSSGGSGGGYYGGQGQINVNGTVFANNQAGGDGGGAYAFDGQAVGKALFDGNTATGAGGGLFLERFAHITATQFLGNAADLGGGLAISRTFPGTAVQFVHNSLFARNTATTGGAGIYYNQPRPIDLIYNTIANPATAGGAAIQIITGTVGITNNIIANHATGIEVVNGVVTETYNLFSGNTTTNISGVVVGGTGSFTGNPAFVDPANDDYHLTSDSLAINKAVDAGVLTDFDGDPRPGGDGFDIGFDETAFSPVLQVSKTATPNTNVSYRGGLTYTITLSNGSVFDANNVVFTDTLPGEVDFARWVEQPAGANVSADEITWTGLVPANDAVRFTFVVNHIGDYGETVTNLAQYSQAGNQGSAEAAFSVQPHVTDLLISKSSVRDNDAGLITYSVIVQNLGPTEADGTLISDPIPVGINGFTWQCTATGGASCTVNGMGGINDTLANFPAGSQVVYSITATMVSTDVTVINEATLIPPPGVTNTAPTNSAINISLPLQLTYLPFVIKDFLAAPDLVVDSLSAGQNAVTVTIKNIGNVPVIDGFWVDVYLNPTTPPTHVNQHWHDLGDQGLVWGLTDPNIGPGQTLILTLDHAAYRPDLSHFVTPLPIGSNVYAQVDSVNLLTNYGGVLELHEITGGPYNNIAQTISTAALGNQAAISSSEQPEPTNQGLPSR